MEPTVFVVDDDQGIRKALRHLVSQLDFDVRCFDSAEAFLDAYQKDWLGCLLLDVRMPGMSGFELHDRLVSLESGLPVIFITGQADIENCVQSMKKGAFDFLEKPYGVEDLGKKIRLAVKFAIEIRDRRDKEGAAHLRFQQLNAQEVEILRKLAGGDPNKKIAEDLDLSLRTIQLRRTSIMEKLGVGTRAELVKIALLHDQYLQSNSDSSAL